MSNKDFLTVVSPVGTLSLVWLNQPSQYGKYQASVTVPLDEAQRIIDSMEELRDRKLKIRSLQEEPEVAGVVMPFKIDEEAGEVTFKFRMNAEKKSRTPGGPSTPERPVVVDAQRRAIDTSRINIGSGSRGRLNGVGYMTFMSGKKGQAGQPDEPPMGYISIKLKAAQIIELSQSNVDYTSDFDQVEGGYDFSAEEVESVEGFEVQ